MIRQSLDGAWELRQAGTTEWLPGSVPGGVHTDLLALGRIPDPFAADNELRVVWVAAADWEYRRTFTVDAATLAAEHVELVFEGLDTLAEVQLNGAIVGRAANMFHAWRWHVRAQLHEGTNEVLVRFASPVTYIAARDAERRLPGVNEMFLPGGPYLRKAPSHFGWDWGPKLPAIGIWRPVRLEAWSGSRLDDVHLRQRHEAGRVTLSARVATRGADDAPGALRLTVTAPDGSVAGTTQGTTQGTAEGSADLVLEIAEPALWWPNGFGGQPLYGASVDLLAADGSVVDSRAFSVGLRSLELRQEPDQFGRSFTFVVNGVPIFAKGTNWIPADTFPTRVTPERLEHLLCSVAAANHTMIRTWGGGYYEDEAFFDLCDRLGILVWQDFQFACAVYPLHDPAFVESLAVEVEAAVRRLRHHACLALWCGNNEMETGWTQWGWTTPESDDLRVADVTFFYATLPGWLRTLDPDTPYWPSSPSSQAPHENPNSNATGDNHLWEVWHALKPISHYRTQAPRFASEFGFESLPAPATIASYAGAGERNLTSHVMEHHQRHPMGNGKIIAYMTEHFRLPDSFESLAWLTQAMQMEAVRVGVEHWRRIRERCSGTLYWQLDDCWPVASWSSIDYFGRWKALHYASRRFYAPVLLSIEDDGARMAVHVTNDLPVAQAGECRWSLETLDGGVIANGVREVAATALADTLVLARDFAAEAEAPDGTGVRRDLVFVAELWQAGARVSLGCATLVPDKHVPLRDPGLVVATGAAATRAAATRAAAPAGVAPVGVAPDDRLEIRIRSASLARFVELRLDGCDAPDLIFSDNWFHLPAGREAIMTCPIPAGWTAEAAAAAIRVRSLVDTYA